MPINERKDPYVNFRFLVEINGIVHAGFTEVLIPDSKTDVIEYREGNEQSTIRKLPGSNHFGKVILKWGMTTSMELYEKWRRPVEQGKIAEARRNMSIILLDQEGNEASRWEFNNAWPSKYDAPYLNAKGNDIAIETLEIEHEGMIKIG